MAALAKERNAALLTAADPVVAWFQYCSAETYEHWKSALNEAGKNDAQNEQLFTRPAAFAVEMLCFLSKAKEEGKVKISAKTDEGVIFVEKRYQDVVVEAENFLGVLICIARELDDCRPRPDDVGPRTAEVASILDTSAEEGGEVDVPELRLKMLLMLLRQIPDTETRGRLPVLQRILRIARSQRLFDIIEPSVARNINSLTAAWDISTSTRLGLHWDLYAAARDQGANAATTSRILENYLCLCEDADDAELTDVTYSAAAAYVSDAMARDGVLQFDAISRLKAVARLQSIPQYKALHALLMLMKSGDYADLEALLAKDPQLLERHGIDKAAAVRKLRLLKLATICSAALSAAQESAKSDPSIEAPAIALSQICSELDGVSVEEGEELVAQAILMGVVDGRIDKVSDTVYLRDAMVRDFSASEWKILHEKLTALEGVLQKCSSRLGVY